MAKVRVKNFYDGQPPTARPGDEISIPARLVDSLVATGKVERVAAPKAARVATRPQGRAKTAAKKTTRASR